MADKETTFQAPWTPNLSHRPDPNRVGRLPAQVLERESQPLASQRDGHPSAVLTPGEAHRSTELDARRAVQASAEPSYYDVSPLKPPVWKWEIASYFFFGGLSSGSYLLARAAERACGDRLRAVRKAGALVAFATVLPCPPLLIADLGDPKRFHHMLRIFKPRSPMSVGSWSLVGYSGMTLTAAIRELLPEHLDPTRHERGVMSVLAKTWLAVHDFIGIPFALMMAGYTGVLLSSTSNPLWRQNVWLGPLFSASALSTGAESIVLALEFFPAGANSQAGIEHAQDILMRVDTVAHAAEFVAEQAFEAAAGERAQPLKRGKMSVVHKVAVGALVAAEVIKLLPISQRWKRPARIASAAAGLVAGFALRWSMVYGGKEAGADAELSHRDLRRKA